MQIIKRAMRERAPLMFEQLYSSGRLNDVLGERAEQAEIIYEAALSAVNERALLASRGLSDQDTISEMIQGRNHAARTALDQAADFEELEIALKPMFAIFEVEGRAIIEGWVQGRGAWAAVWRDGAWHSAPGLVCKEGVRLTMVHLLREFPDADLEAARAFARDVPTFAFSPLGKNV